MRAVSACRADRVAEEVALQFSYSRGGDIAHQDSLLNHRDPVGQLAYEIKRLLDPRVHTLDLLLVCAGGEPAAFADHATFAWLRRLAVNGTRVASVSGGPFILAKAGIMDGIRMTIHWRHAQAVREAHPNVLITRSLFTLDRNRLTCAGGTAPLDMMHALIAERHGAELARRVSDWFLHTEIRSAKGAQRASAVERCGVHNASLIAALELMEGYSGKPLRRTEVAR